MDFLPKENEAGIIDPQKVNNHFRSLSETTLSTRTHLTSSVT